MLHLMRPLDRGTYPAGAGKYAPRYLEAWLRHFPAATPSQRDKEDWVENACFIDAFERVGVDFEILGECRGIMLTATEDSLASGTGQGAFFHSGVSRADTVDSNYRFPLQGKEHLKAISRHALADSFAAAAGRKMILVPPSASAINEAVRQIVPAEGPVFIKTLKKGMARIFNIRADMSPMDAIVAQDEDIAWTLVQFDGVESPFFSIQGVIEPTFEYRMFIVDGSPVTGAGCVESFTPLDNAARFDPKMEEIRNDGLVNHEYRLVEQYLAFALRLARKLTPELAGAPAYGLDLCVDRISGNIVPIEVNPPLNLGRYASDVEAWVKAIDNQPA